MAYEPLMIGKSQSERMRVMVDQTMACSHIGAAGQYSSTRIIAAIAGMRP
jgi:hypothetical protein